MEDTKKTKKPASKNKNKNNYEPKWKSKKESKATKTTEAPVKKKAPEKKTNPVKAETGKYVELKKLVESAAAKEKNKKAASTETKKSIEIKSLVEELLAKEKIASDAVKAKQKEKSPKEVINKKESGKTVNKEKLVKKYDITETMPISLPDEEELDKIYEDLKKEQVEEKTAPTEVKVNKKIFKKKHYNYISRIATLIAMIILFLILCVLFIFKALDYQLGGSTTYSEYTSNDYIVCENGVTEYNKDNCLAKDLEYNSFLVNNIHTTFNYEAVYSKKHNFNSSYYVTAKLKIADPTDSTRANYIKDYTLINDTDISVSGEVIVFSADVDIDFNNYKNLALKYMIENGFASRAELEVGLFLRQDDVSRKISYITIPLTDNTFMIKSSNLDNKNQLLISNVKTRTVDPFYIFIAVICLLMDILLFTYLINLMYMVEHLDNEYNATLKRILKEYDELIVNATTDYIIPEGVKVIEVESFEELMDARDTLEKPIVYEKINNIKSRFYVEDRNTVYMYTMKDDGE